VRKLVGDPPPEDRQGDNAVTVEVPTTFSTDCSDWQPDDRALVEDEVRSGEVKPNTATGR
jgi:hypothetical protein